VNGEVFKMKKKIVLFVLLIAVMFANTGLFAQKRNLKPSGIKVGEVSKCWGFVIINYTGPKNNPDKEGCIFDTHDGKVTRRFPYFIRFPNEEKWWAANYSAKFFNGYVKKCLNESVSWNQGGTKGPSGVTYIETGNNQTVEFMMTQEKLWGWLGSKTRIYILQPNSRIDKVMDNDNGGFKLVKGSIQIDEDHKKIQKIEENMEMYASNAEGLAARVIVPFVNSKKSAVGYPSDPKAATPEQKDALADKVIDGYGLTGGVFSAMKTAIPEFLMPLEWALGFADNCHKAGMAYALSYVYFGKEPTYLSKDLLVLFAYDDDTELSTVSDTLENAGDVMDTMKVIAKLGGETKLVQNLMKKAAAKAAKEGFSAADNALPVVSDVAGVLADISEIEKFGNRAKKYYRTISGTAKAAKAVKTVKVTFNSNGGTPNPAPKDINVGSAYGDLPTITRTGYDLKGWYTAATGGTKVEKATKVTDKDHTLYAQWNGKNVTVTFNSNGGDALSPPSKTVKVGDKYGPLPTPKRANCTFEGWRIGTSATSRLVTADDIVPVTDQMVYAHWKEIDGKKADAGPQQYKIGDTGPGGGFVFSAQVKNLKWVYMECSKELGGKKVNYDEAVKLAGAYKGEHIRGQDVSGWKLPTKEELDLMYKNLKQKKLGNFKDESYGGSNTTSAGVWEHNFQTDKTDDKASKTEPRWYRAVREFN